MLPYVDVKTAVGWYRLRYKAIVKSWVKTKPLVWPHTWATWLPAALPAGAHAITPWTIAVFGQRPLAHLAVEVLGH
jgi:hypothetical protein